jgi:DNA-binding response OmpR family regulator
LDPGPPTIAVVEDDADIRSLIEHVLTQGGYRTVSTSDPAEAVELVRREDPGLVLCDIAMPGMDGYAVLRALQSDPITARYPVVFITAHSEFSQKVRAFRYGAVDYVTKPFTSEGLLRKVERLLKGLGERRGVADSPGGEGLRTLMDEIRQESRSGVLRVRGEEGEGRLVIRAGQVVDSSPGASLEAARSAQFEELDAAREDIVLHDPPRLPGDHVPVPEFEALPELVREVLVVDDNALFRRFLRDLLTIQGFRVLEAADGETALELALEQRPWLILTDVRLPGIDGFELCRRIRGQRLLRQIPLIFLSGWDDYKQRYQALGLGADDFLSKQTSVRELLIRVHLLLRRYMDLRGRADHGAGMAGQVGLIGPPAILQMCHLNGLSGVLTARDGERRVRIAFEGGEIVRAGSKAASGNAAVFDFVGWDRGSFEFAAGVLEEGAPVEGGFEFLLLEGCRQLDEAARAASETQLEDSGAASTARGPAS